MAQIVENGKFYEVVKSKSNIEESSVIVPVDIQTRYAQTIQTHNAVSVGAGGGSDSAWVDTNGFDKLAVLAQNDAGTAWSIEVQWSPDGTSLRGLETLVASSTTNSKSGITDIKARYARVTLKNADTVAHIMSSWAYLKA